MISRTRRFCAWMCLCSLITLIVAEDAPKQKNINYANWEFPEWNYMNFSADPCEDFYEFTCGNFKSAKPIPEDYPYIDHYAIVQDELEEKCREIIEEPKKINDPTALRKAKDMFAGCMDTYFIDRLGLGELERLLIRLGGLPIITPGWKKSNGFSWYQIADISSEFGIPTFFNFYAQSNLFDSNEMLVYIDRDSLLLPFQLVDNPRTVDDYIDNNLDTEIRDDIPYVVYLIEMVQVIQKYTDVFVPYNKIREEVLEVVEFMKKLKSAGSLPLKKPGATPILPMTVKELQKWTQEYIPSDKKLNWKKYLCHIFTHTKVKISDKTRIYMPFFTSVVQIIQLFNETPERIINNFAILRLLTYLGPETHISMRSAAEKFYATQGHLSYPRWKTCLRKVLDFPSIGMSGAIAYEYRKRHVPEHLIQHASTMVYELRKSFLELMISNDWMDAETKKLAKIKADSLLVQMGFPNEVNNDLYLDEHFKPLRICRYDHFGNMNRLRAFSLRLNLIILDEPRDRNRWSQSPLLVNAYYNKFNNRVTFPMSLMHPPFFTSGMRVMDYSRIGAVIGHEITHAFDNSSKNLDGSGQLTEWWMGNTLSEYNKRAECFIQQYNEKIIPEIGKPVPGAQTLNENIADNGGLREAYIAFKLITRSHPTEYQVGKKLYTAEQMFFISYGTGWCETRTTESFQSYYPKMIHSPSRFRANVPVSNMPEFAEAFKCPAGSSMVPKQRCIIW